MCANKANADDRIEALMQEKQYNIWSCGGGVDSTAIAALIIQGKIDKPDYAIMTDNGYDGSYTWKYVNEILKPNLSAIGVDLHIIKTKDYTSTELVDGNGFVTIPAYTKRDGSVIKYDTRCSNRWKLQPALKWIKEQGIKRCVNIIGIAADERNRMKQSNRKWIEYRYPLVQMNYARRDCIRLIKSMGWPVPQHSACVMCPQKTDNEWLDLRDDYPDDWDRAVKLEGEIRRVRPDVYLHKSCKSLDEADFHGGGYED